MRRKRDGIELRKSLRLKAEKLVTNLSPEGDNSTLPVDVLLHELLVNRIELELQNEELCAAYLALTTTRDRYFELYETAPVGYITLTHEGLIGEINLTGAVMLGVARSQLVGHHFARFIANSDSDRWHCQLQNLIQQPDGERRALRLTMIRRNEEDFVGYLDCVRSGSSDETAMVRVTLIDINKILLV